MPDNTTIRWDRSLKIRIALLTAGLVLLGVIVAVWQSGRTEEALVEEVAAHSSKVIIGALRSSLIHAMEHEDPGEVLRVLRRVEAEPEVAAIRVFTPSGRIVLSPREEEMGSMAATIDLETYRQNPGGFSFRRCPKGTFAATLPIENEPSCTGCHDASQKVLGVLNLRLYIGTLAAVRAQGRFEYVKASLAVLLLVAIGVPGFFLLQVDRPIRALMGGMTLLEKGRFDEAKVRLRGSPEMELMAAKFNQMVDRLRDLVNSKLRYERELAVRRKQLEHQEEMRRANEALEARLAEIRALNEALEERVREVELAKWRVARMAEDLENQNTELEEAVGRLSALHSVGLLITSTMESERLFDLLLHQARDSLGARVAYILLLDRERWCLRYGYVLGLSPAVVDPEEQIPLKPGGVSHWVIHHQRPLLLPRVADFPEFARESRLGFIRESVICAPLFVDEEVIGTITVANRTDGGEFDASDLEFLSTVASQASVALKNARLYEERQRNYLHTVQALVSAVEARDRYTRGHSERVTRLSLSIAARLALSTDPLRDLEHAGILHDIGKIGIEDALLRKPGRLTPMEMARIQEHPEIGMRILEPVPFLERVRAIVGQHHERYDGRGYPRGLAGEEILLEARILAVADSFDAMTSDRPYRPALTVADALAEVERNAGSQFDPDVARAFLDQVQTEGLAFLFELEPGHA